MGLGSLPPIEDEETLARELDLVPARHRADAFQEAWLAHLEGKSDAAVIQSVKTYAVREYRIEQRRAEIVDEDGDEPHAIDRDGSKHELPASQQSNSEAASPFRGAMSRLNSLAKAG